MILLEHQFLRLNRALVLILEGPRLLPADLRHGFLIQDSCFYVGSFCQALFVIGLNSYYTSLSPRSEGHLFAVGLLPHPHALEEGSRLHGAAGKP
jgi:hypothetical protein